VTAPVTRPGLRRMGTIASGKAQPTKYAPTFNAMVIDPVCCKIYVNILYSHLGRSFELDITVVSRPYTTGNPTYLQKDLLSTNTLVYSCHAIRADLLNLLFTTLVYGKNGSEANVLGLE